MQRKIRNGQRNPNSESLQKPAARKRPNHFFAIQINDSQVFSVVDSVQREIVTKEPLLQSALVSTETLHITLILTHIADDLDLKKARQVLEETARSIPPFDIHLKNLGHFDNQVVYARVEQPPLSEDLNKLWGALREGCIQQGLAIFDADTFTPHLTLLKLSKDRFRLKKKGITKVPNHLYQEQSELTFGTQLVQSIQLLSMDDPRDENGYYAKKGEFHLNIRD